jgi:hypothetical protein
MTTRLLCVLAVACLSCAPSAEPQGLLATPFGTGAQVKFDAFHRPLPDIPLPNDFATRFDPGSPTGLRLNASMLAATAWEQTSRRGIDALDGWGTYAALSVGFDAPLDVLNVARRHQGDDYDFRDDAVLVVNVTPDSPDFCRPVPLDVREGNFPLVLEQQDVGLPTDPRLRTEQLVFDEANEDLNRNGRLDLGEDTDMDGVLDRGNFARDTDGRFQAMSFYERETDTLILKPVLPMREGTTYAAVLTRRLTDQAGKAVRSPFAFINHAEQTKALEPLRECLPGLGLALDDVAFTWSFTTQTVTTDYVAVRDGLYGKGPLQRLATEYPAEVSELFRLTRNLPAGQSEYLVRGSDLVAVGAELFDAAFGGIDRVAAQAMIDSYRWVDFVAVGQVVSPQFFRRTRGPHGQWGERDDEGAPYPLLPADQQVFELDPVTGAAFTRPEPLTFWLTVPKGRQGRPAPVVVLSHGYTSSKLEAMLYGGFFARLGLATVAIDAVSHGLETDAIEAQVAKALLERHGLGDLFTAVSNDRAFDQNGDGRKDVGADFWSAYLLHTRDVVKQSVMDHLQLLRMLKAFDGQHRWRYDVDRDGAVDLAGDFDGDGTVDVGGPASLHATGASLGGILSAMLGGVEPYLETTLPVAGGAGLADVGVRSTQGGVREAVNLTLLGPFITTQRKSCPSGVPCDPLAQPLELAQWVPDLNRKARLKLADFEREPNDGDTVVIRNVRTGEYRCTRVHSDPSLGRSLIGGAVSADVGDALSVEIYSGALPPRQPEGCEVSAGAVLTHVFSDLQYDVTFQGVTRTKGSPIVAFTTGFGLRRNSAELRRFMGLAQLAIESADPVNFAPFYERWLLEYGTGETVRTRAMVIPTVGDTNVPVATGIALARAAGFVELFAADPRYGKTPNRVLIDQHVIEGVERAGPFINTVGQPVLMDVDFYSRGAVADDFFDVPRLDPPLRLQAVSEKLGGWRGLMLPMSSPTGKHGFDPPKPGAVWDLGSFMFGAMSRYMSTDGRELNLEACNADFSCAYFPQTPPN